MRISLLRVNLRFGIILGYGKSASIVFFSVILLSSTVLFSMPTAYANGDPADIALGQANLNSAVSNLSDLTLRTPTTTAIDGSGNLWVADTNNNRVLRYDSAISSGDAASIVLGQPDFVSNGVGLDDSSFNSPRGLAIDGSGNLWVSDSGNNRVLRFSVGGGFTNGQAADLVVGQSDFTSGSANPGGVASDTLSNPQGIFIDGSGNLWVADAGNNRVLKYNTPSSDGAADLVLGQGGFGTSASGTTDTTLNHPNGVTVDGSGNVWIADTENNRVLKFNAPSSDGEAADLVLGQPDFVSNANNNLSVTASTLNKPQSVAIDGSGNAWVADGSNNRLLFYATPSTDGQAATQVLGHTLLAEGDPNAGGLSAASLFSPQNVIVDGSTVWTADAANNRVLRYSTLTTGSSADLVLGQSDFTSNNSGSGGLSASSQSLPQGVITDSLGNVWVADTANNRVLRYSTLATGAAADVVLGQADFTSNEIGFDSRSLVAPTDLGIDPDGNLWVVDSGNSRVVKFNDGDTDPNTSNFATNDAATQVLGQPDFSTNLPNQGGPATDSTMNFPVGILVEFLDEPNFLVVAVADTGNDRILLFADPVGDGIPASFVMGGSGPVSATTLSGPTDISMAPIAFWISDTGNNRIVRASPGNPAETVLGQPNFDSNSPNAFGVSAQSLSSPRGLATDADGNLWVADSGNHRTLIFPNSLADQESAVGVLGQLDFTSNDSNNGGISANSQSSPNGVALDSNGELWVADTSNNRALHYDQLPDLVDTDGDDVPDSADDCPNEAGDVENNGCPQGGGPPPDDSAILNAINDAKQMILTAIQGINDKLELMWGDITNIALNVDDVQQTVGDIRDEINNEEYGLEEIKKEVRFIEGNVTSPEFGLEEIKDEVREIETAVVGPDSEIQAIQDKLSELELQISNIETNVGDIETIQRVEISVSRSDGSDEYLVLTTLSGLPVDATYDKILVLNNQAQVTELTAADYTVTSLDTGLSLLEIDKKAIKGGIRAIELVVSFTDGGTTSHGAILFEDNVDKNTAQ